MWLNLQETADLVTFTEEVLDGKLHFLCSLSTLVDLHWQWFPSKNIQKSRLQ